MTAPDPAQPPMQPPVRKCSCQLLMETVTVATAETHTALTYVCEHCDRGPCDTKHCSLCKALQQADADNRKP